MREGEKPRRLCFGEVTDEVCREESKAAEGGLYRGKQRDKEAAKAGVVC